MRVLVTAASRHGSTLEIAEAISAGLERRGLNSDFRSIEDVHGMEGYDAAVLGSGVYMGHWLDESHRLVNENADALGSRRVWLFSSGPLGPPEHLRPEGDPVDVAEITKRVSPEAHRVFAGKLDKSQLGFRERAMVRAVHAPEGDFRDWSAVDTFAGEIAARLSSVSP
jgi:menaquinone-dependent protoporphyrinogen oxidase